MTLEVGDQHQPPARWQRLLGPWIVICGDTGGLISLSKIPDLFLSRQVGRKVPHLSVAAGTKRNIHSAKNRWNLLSVVSRCFFFWFICWRSLVHVLQLSWLPFLRNKCANNFLLGFFVLLWRVGGRSRGSTGNFFSNMFHSKFSGTYRTWTCADWDVCLNHLITCGLHLDVAKKPITVPLYNTTVVFVLTGRFNLYIAERLPSQACFILRCDFYRHWKSIKDFKHLEKATMWHHWLKERLSCFATCSRWLPRSRPFDLQLWDVNTDAAYRLGIPEQWMCACGE